MTSLVGFTGICISLIDHFASSVSRTLRDLVEVTETITVVSKVLGFKDPKFQPGLEYHSFDEWSVTIDLLFSSTDKQLVKSVSFFLSLSLSLSRSLSLTHTRSFVL